MWFSIRYLSAVILSSRNRIISPLEFLKPVFLDFVEEGSSWLITLIGREL